MNVSSASAGTAGTDDSQWAANGGHLVTNFYQVPNVAGFDSSINDAPFPFLSQLSLLWLLSVGILTVVRHRKWCDLFPDGLMLALAQPIRECVLRRNGCR